MNRVQTILLSIITVVVIGVGWYVTVGGEWMDRRAYCSDRATFQVGGAHPHGQLNEMAYRLCMEGVAL